MCGDNLTVLPPVGTFGIAGIALADMTGVSPLAVLLAAMRARWQSGDLDGAAGLARAAAPYLHPRRAAVPYWPGKSAEPDQMIDAELEQLLRQFDAGEAASDKTSQQPDGILPLCVDAERNDAGRASLEADRSARKSGAR